MNTKFQVGQVWKNRAGIERSITHVGMDGEYPVKSFTESNADSFTAYGHYFQDGSESDMDLVELVTYADGTPAAAATALPLEAKPGLDFVAGELKAFEPDARETFIHKLIHSAAITAVEQSLTFKDVADTVRDAVKLRDELLKAAD